MLIKAARESCGDAGILVMRVALGLFFLFHGAQKLLGVFGGMGLGAYASLINDLQLPLPQYTAVAIASIEFSGGLALTLGLWSRCAACCLAVTLVATGWFASGRLAEVQLDQVIYPANLAYLLIGMGFTLAGLALTGPGRFSLTTLFAGARVELPSSEIPRRETKTHVREIPAHETAIREIPTRVAT